MAGAYPSFCSMKQLTVLLLPPEWDASPSRGYPPQYVTGTHNTPGWRETMWNKVSLSKETTRRQGLGLKPPTFRSEVQCTNHYTITPSFIRQRT